VLDKSLSTFQASVRAATRGLYLGELDNMSAADALFSAIGRGFEQAWREGAREAGILANERTKEESDTLALMIGDQYQYVRQFVQWIYEHNKTSGAPYEMILARAQMWINRYNQVVTRAREMGDLDAKEVWLYNPAKEHCCDCARMHNRVYRNSIWFKYGIEPNSSALACFGGNCGCKRQKTDLPITKGRPPALRGPGGCGKGKKKELNDNQLAKAH